MSWGRVNDALDRRFLEKTIPNRNPIWNDIVITRDEIDKRMHRVGSEGICECGKLNGDHPFSEAVLKLTGNYLYELCNGWLGKF